MLTFVTLRLLVWGVIVKINHETFTFYAGCRQHHQEEHQIGTKNFLNKYQIKPVKLNIEERKKLNIGG